MSIVFSSSFAPAWCDDATRRAESGAAAMRRSLDLHRRGDWADDVRKLVVFPRDAYCARQSLVRGVQS